jgi:hypothetical protein
MNNIEIRQTIILKQKQFINIKNQKILYKKISSIFETYELKEKFDEFFEYLLKNNSYKIFEQNFQKKSNFISIHNFRLKLQKNRIYFINEFKLFDIIRTKLITHKVIQRKLFLYRLFSQQHSHIDNQRDQKSKEIKQINKSPMNPTILYASFFSF